jgi:glycosyltransferase involved in cell wall biosynthesis
MTPLSLSVVVPALNEERHIAGVVAGIREALDRAGWDWEVIIVNDGSTDSTGVISNSLSEADPRVKVLHHERPGGVGFSFRHGASQGTKQAVTWVPGDGQNDLSEILKYLPLLEHVDIVVPFVVNTGVRSLGRRLLSTLYLWIINLSFGISYTYTNGTAAYRRRIFDVIKLSSDGFFFSTECLIKSTRAGFIFAEVPVRLQERRGGVSKAISLKSLYSVVRDFLKLFYAVHILRTAGRVNIAPGSLDGQG